MTNPTPAAGQLQSGLAVLPLRREADFSNADGVGSFQIIAVVLLLLLFVGVVVWRRRRAGLKLSGKWRQWINSPVDTGATHLMQSTQLTPSASVHVLRWDGREWLLGCSEQGISVIAERQQATPENSDARDGA